MCLFLWITLSRQRDKFSARSARDVNVVRNPFASQKRSLKEERRGNNSVEERKRQWWKERVRKFRANIILQFTLCFFWRAWGFFFYMSAVIRSDAVRQQMPSEERPSGRTHRLHLHSTLQQHEAKRWGCCCSATQCQCRAYYGWRHEKEKKDRLHYSLGRKTLKSNTPQKACFFAWTGKITCCVIREHMLPFSATSQSGSVAAGWFENKCFKPEEAFSHYKKESCVFESAAWIDI